MPQAEQKYLEVSIGAQGTCNPDAALEAIAENEFSEVRNLRQTVPGEYEIRTNYHDYAALTSGSVDNTAEVICTAEYKFVDATGNVTSFDITVYHDSTAHEIKFVGLNRASIGGSTNWATQFNRHKLPNSDHSGDLNIADNGVADPIKGYAVQYGSDLAITLFGIGVYVIYPGKLDGTPDPLADNWIVRQIGKDRASVPENSFPLFKDQQQGDLFLILYDETFISTSNGKEHQIHQRPLLPGTQPESIFPPVQYIRIPMNATYFNANNTAFNTGTDLRFWQASQNDPSIPTNPARSNGHLQERGWGYRFVFVHKYIDSKGNHITYRSAPSIDIWVPNEVYCPPQVYADDTITSPRTAHDRIGQLNSVHYGGTSPLPLSGGGPRFLFSDQFNMNGSSSTIPYPDAASVRALGQAMIAYNGQSWQYDTGGNYDNVSTGIQESAWLAALWWVGFWRVFDVYEAMSYYYSDFRCPYFVEVTANDLASAPLTDFKWSQFNSVPADVTEIEIYRTAYDGSDKTVTLNGQVQPLYQPNLFGYAGSLKRPDSGDSEFIDDVTDEELDFGSDASSFDGLLAGDFSGAVMEEYNTNLAIGDISTNYHVEHPWDLYQIFIYGNAADSGGDKAHVLGGSHPSSFELQYIDTDGNVSSGAQLGALGGSTPIFYIPGVAGGTHWSNMVAVMPAGYDPIITGIRLLFLWGTDDGGDGLWHLVKTVSPNDKYVTATYAECTGGLVLSDDSGSGTITSIDQGALIWSNAGDIFTFASLNYKLVHPSAPVMALKSILGELWCWSDRSTCLTNLAGRFEEENKDIGCIGRFAALKMDKVVFFLSAKGMYFAEASGIVPFPGFVQNLIRQYTNERITGVPDLKNISRAALGYQGKHNELWLYLPGSDDLGGSLPAKLIIFKFFENSPEERAKFTVGLYWAHATSVVLNYFFTLLADGNLGYTGTNGAYVAGIQSIYQPLIFTQHSDQKLFCAYKNETDHLIHTLDVDNMIDGDFQGNTFLEKPLNMGAGILVKILRGIRILGDFTANLFIKHGAPRLDGVADYTTGMVFPTAAEWEYKDPSGATNLNVHNQMFNHRIGGAAARDMSGEDVAASTSYVPIARWRSQPDISGNHKVHYKNILALIRDLHNHPS